MKKYLLLLIAISAISFSATAQNDTVRKTYTWIFNEKTVIKDSTGVQIPYVTWRKMLSTGEYLIRPIDPRDANTDFLIFDKKHGSTFTFLNNSHKPEERSSTIAELPRPPESTFFKIGEKISSFRANDIDGNKIKLKDLEGKIVVINFWFIGCPPCRMEIPELNKLALEYANNPDVVFIAIGLDNKYDIQQFIKNNPFAYHLIEDGRMYADLYRLNLYPTNLVLDKEGKVRFSSTSYPESTPYWIKKTIEELSKVQ